MCPVQAAMASNQGSQAGIAWSQGRMPPLPQGQAENLRFFLGNNQGKIMGLLDLNAKFMEISWDSMILICLKGKNWEISRFFFFLMGRMEIFRGR